MLTRTFATIGLMLATSVVLAQAPTPNPVVRLRGSIESVAPGSVTLRERSGEVVTLVLPDNTPLTEVVPIRLESIQVGSFIGSAAMTRPDGSLEALEVLVFPESARGTGEGHYPWDLAPQSTMTNATVADLAVAPNGRTLKLRYKDGEKTLNVPTTVPVVTFKPGGIDLIVPGARVLINAQVRDGKPTALRVLAGRNGVAPPM
jgi:hypothetical protein